MAIVGAALVVKLPQLYKIWKNGSAKGISRISAYAELCSYFNTMAYARHLNNPIQIYAETIAISIQNLIVVLTIYWYDDKLPLHEKILFLGTFGAYATILLADEKVNEQQWHMVSASVILCSAMARGT